MKNYQGTSEEKGRIYHTRRIFYEAEALKYDISAEIDTMAGE